MAYYYGLVPLTTHWNVANQNPFVKSWVCRTVSHYAAICLETGQGPVETRAWFITIKLWLHLPFKSDPSSLIFHMLLESHRSKWLACTKNKI